MNSRYLETIIYQPMTILTVDQACELLELFHQLSTIKLEDIFTKLNETPHRLKRIGNSLQQINLIDDQSVDNTTRDTHLTELSDELDKLSNSLCIDLNEWMEYERFEIIIIRDMSYSNALFSAALTLANINPINTLDPITQEAINPENRVVTTDRYQHDIFNLIKWLTFKNSNPFTGLELNRRNLVRLKLIFDYRLAKDKTEGNLINNQPSQESTVVDTIRLASPLQSEGWQRVRMPSILNLVNTRETALNFLRIYFSARLPRWRETYLVVAYNPDDSIEPPMGSFFRHEDQTNDDRVLPSLIAASRASLFYHQRHSLNLIMMELTIKRLNGLLLPEHFKDWPSNNRFTKSHSDALIYLIKEENYLPLDAINFIKTLDENEVVIYSMPLRPLSPGLLGEVD